MCNIIFLSPVAKNMSDFHIDILEIRDVIRGTANSLYTTHIHDRENHGK
jgi:hypothetical protein